LLLVLAVWEEQLLVLLYELLQVQLLGKGLLMLEGSIDEGALLSRVILGGIDPLEAFHALVDKLWLVLLYDDASVLTFYTRLDAGLVVVGSSLVLESHRRSYMLRRFRREHITKGLQGWRGRYPKLR
jgi:hypothetical protein